MVIPYVDIVGYILVGTNYYLHEKPACPCCGHREKPIHIGKSSWGWVFSLHVGQVREDTFDKYGNRQVHCVSSLREWIKKWSEPGSEIKDEYGEDVTSEEMLAIIISSSGYKASDVVKTDDSKFEITEEGLTRFKVDYENGIYCMGHGDNYSDTLYDKESREKYGPGTWDLIMGEFS